jgi:hypothetical protein
MKITLNILKFDFFSSPSETFQIKEVIGSFGKSGKYYFIDELCLFIIHCSHYVSSADKYGDHEQCYL